MGQVDETMTHGDKHRANLEHDIEECGYNHSADYAMPKEPHYHGDHTPCWSEHDFPEDAPTPEWLTQHGLFTDLMIAQMERNSHKGMREAWIGYPLEQSMTQLQISIAELRTALAYGVDVDEKAADVGNWAYIVQDCFYNNPTLRGIPANARFSGE